MLRVKMEDAWNGVVLLSKKTKKKIKEKDERRLNRKTKETREGKIKQNRVKDGKKEEDYDGGRKRE